MMTYLQGAIQLLFLLAFPLAILYLAARNRIARAIGPVIICYLMGLLIGNLPGMPLLTGVSQTATEATIPMAICLLLFSTDFVKWLKHAKTSVCSFLLGVVGVVVSSVVVSGWLFPGLEEVWKMAGMAVGVYTGGTPNMSAIGQSLEVDEEVFVLLNASDLLVSGIYLLFLLSIAQRALLLFLPAFRAKGEAEPETTAAPPPSQPRPFAQRLAGFGIALALSLLIVGASAGLSLLASGEMKARLVLLTLTALGIAASFHPRIRGLPGTYALGEYFLLVFCVAIGTLSNFAELLSSSPTIFTYTACVITGAILLHYLLAALFRIDADTVLITSTAGIFGPAFVPPVAAALRNKAMIVSGLTTGLVGYAIANFAGLAVAYFVKHYLLG